VARHGNLTPERTDFRPSYGEPDHLWLAVHFTRSKQARRLAAASSSDSACAGESRPEVNEQVAPHNSKRWQWGIRFKGSYDYLNSIGQPTLVVNGGMT